MVPTANLRDVAMVGSALVLLTLILLPCVVKLQPAVYFDVDPRSPAASVPIDALGPTGMAWLSVLGVLASAMVLAVVAWVGGRIYWLPSALTAMGMVAAVWHMPVDLDSRLIGSGWIAAASIGLAVLHLAQFDKPRRWLIAGMIAILIPIALQAIWFILVDHPATIANFKANETEFLASRGWVAGSPQHELYVRRLESPDAVGAFGLANVLGSVAVALTLAAVGVGVGTLLRSRREMRWFALPALAAAVLGLVTVWLTHSKGALLVLPMGVGLAMVALIAQRLRVMRWAVPVLAVLAVVVGIAAVMVRGAAGPPSDWQGERSLLFRYQYWQASARIAGSDLPKSALLGVGPSGYKDAYLWAKNPLNPEEVISSHNVFVDYITMLGVGGWAWSILLMLWLVQAARLAAKPEGSIDETQPARPMRREDFLFATGPAVLVFGTQYVLQWRQLVIETALLWLIGVILFIGTAALLAPPRRYAWRWGAVGLLAAAGAVLVHNQIEMAFYQVASAPLLWAIPALAAGARKFQPSPLRWQAMVPAGGLVVVAGLLVALSASPVTAQQKHLARAAQALQRNHFQAALRELESGGNVLPDVTPVQWGVTLRLEAARALKQMGRPGEAQRFLKAAITIIDKADPAHVPARKLDRLRASTHQLGFALFADKAHLHQAAEALERVLVAVPYNLQDTLNLANIYWELGNTQQAAALYRKAEKLSEQSYLDPAKQLTEQQLKDIQAKLEQVSQAEQATP